MDKPIPLPDLVCTFKPLNGEFCYELILFWSNRKRYHRTMVSASAMAHDPVAMLAHIIRTRGLDEASALRACWAE